VIAKNTEIEKLQGLKKERESILLTIDTENKDLLEKINSRNNQMDELNGIVQKTVAPESHFLKIRKTKKKKINLLWPVSAGFVSSPFGKQNHPFIKDIIIENNGINLLTAKDEVVSSCFEGEVSIVASISGLNNTIIIKNGDYRFVYANVKEVLVKSGDKVEKGQSIA
jgi:murein DD-endopeptidase MepM/ murein hydrolase activator NlpD